MAISEENLVAKFHIKSLYINGHIHLRLSACHNIKIRHFHHVFMMRQMKDPGYTKFIKRTQYLQALLGEGGLGTDRQKYPAFE